MKKSLTFVIYYDQPQNFIFSVPIIIYAFLYLKSFYLVRVAILFEHFESAAK